jgi:hypothetical protein
VSRCLLICHVKRKIVQTAADVAVHQVQQLGAGVLAGTKATVLYMFAALLTYQWLRGKCALLLQALVFHASHTDNGRQPAADGFHLGISSHCAALATHGAREGLV